MRFLNQILMVKFNRQGRSGNLGVFRCGLCKDILMPPIIQHPVIKLLLNNELGNR